MLTTTIPNYHARADNYGRQSIIAGAILRRIKGAAASSLDPTVRRVRKFLGNASEYRLTSDASAQREALSRIILVDKTSRLVLDLNAFAGLMLVVEFGRRGDLTDEEACEAAEFMVRVARMRPDILIGIAVGGFDDDSRRVTDIPECAKHFRRLY